MKRIIKNIFNLLIVFLFVCQVQAVFAYETVALKFPDNEGWHRARYVYGKNEAIAQYTPINQTYEKFYETVVYHSYRPKRQMTTMALLKKQLTPYLSKNKNLQYVTIKNSQDDSILEWCGVSIQNNRQQCEIVRSTRSHDGIILIHYINRDYNDFIQKKDDWLARVSKAKLYYSYYRTDYVLDRKTYFEL